MMREEEPLLKFLDWSAEPIRRMYLPSPEEEDPKVQRGGKRDPLSENQHTPVKGIVHRFENRLLLFPTTKCFVRCRFCFRRNFWTRNFAVENPETAISYVIKSGVKEVIVSGGDPLADPKPTFALLRELKKAERVSVVRISTKAPIFVEKEEFKTMMKEAAEVLQGKTLWFVFHVNHPLELTPLTATNLNSLSQMGIPTVSQTVLLKGVNDSASVLLQLFEELVRLRVKPYYLFLLDPTFGAMHFSVEKERALRIYKELREEGSGLALPFLAYDDPRTLKKIVLSPYQ
jgi:lysine 2,3-aminomutase